MNTKGLKKHMIEIPLAEGDLDLIAGTQLEQAYTQPKAELIETYEHTPDNSFDNKPVPAPKFG